MSTITAPGTSTITSGFNFPGMVGVDGTTARPYTDTQMDIASNRLDALETKLQLRATLSDVYVASMGDVVKNSNSDEFTLPDAITMNMSHVAGANTLNMTILDPVRGQPRAGRLQEQDGYEVGQRIRNIKAFYNEYSHGVTVSSWGVDFNNMDGLYGLYKEATPQLGKFFHEVTGRQFREAGLEVFNRELVQDNVNGIVKHLNPNLFVANTDPFSQPAYSNNKTTMATALISAMDAADTGTNGVNANISVPYLDALIDHAQTTLRIVPLSIGGKDSYVIVLPSNQMAKLTSLTSTLGTLWSSVTSLTKDEMEFPGVIGRYKELLFVSDARYPVFTVTGAATYTVDYVEPGNEDNRNRRVYDATTNKRWSVGMLLGAQAFLDWKVRDLHFEKHVKSYGKYAGISAFTERGVQLAFARTDTQDATSKMPAYIENNGSIALFFTNTSTLAIL